MKDIIYYTGPAPNPPVSFPFPFKTISNSRDLYKSTAPIIIVDEVFLRAHKNFDISRLPARICLLYCAQSTRISDSLLKKYKFFDLVYATDNQPVISFKISRAQKFAELNERILNLERTLGQKNRKLEQMTLLDPTLGCFNWHYFLRRAFQELSRARRHSFHVSFVAVDIDYFRQINEVYGRKVADIVLKDLASLLQTCLRKEDVLTRWREDEFFIIAPYLSRANASVVTRRMMDRVSAHRFIYKSLKLSIKISIGVVSYPEDNLLNTKDVIGALNDCLAAAKKRGGGTTAFYSKAQPKEITEVKEASVEELKKNIEKLNTLLTRDLLEMIYGFAKAIEAKDSYTGKHVEYTALIAEKIARELKLPSSEVDNVMRAAILHDLGKVGISESILGKEGALTPEEREIINSHPVIAAEILKEIHSLRSVIPAILYHHERYDGKGYPSGLKAGEIPLGARIVAIADVYQALISNRPYRKAFTARKAARIVKEEAGRQFDPVIVKLFLRIIKKIGIKELAR